MNPRLYFPSPRLPFSFHILFPYLRYQPCRWMLQKHALGQDIFLIGGPGPRSRRLAMHFCEVAGLEVEYLRLTRDTTEADLKLRRDISGGTARWTESAPVRAALKGRVLILDGIEKAERNVLPTLNNLLENREMALEDGRFMMSARRYDELAASPNASHDLSNIVPVSKTFRVIALGLQVPKFAGFPLDPPLRSRFQARLVNGLSDGCSDAHLAPIPKESMQSLIKVSASQQKYQNTHTHIHTHIHTCTHILLSLTSPPHFSLPFLLTLLTHSSPASLLPSLPLLPPIPSFSFSFSFSPLISSFPFTLSLPHYFCSHSNPPGSTVVRWHRPSLSSTHPPCT